MSKHAARGQHAAICLVLLLAGSTTGAASDRVWDPTQRQEVEPDTLFLLDADAEQKLLPGEGGLIAGDGTKNKPWVNAVATPGKFRAGIKSLVREYGYLWMPADGFIPADQFTIEFFACSDKPWEQCRDQTPLRIFDEHQTGEITFRIHGGRMEVLFAHPQDAAGPVRVVLPYDVKKNAIPAGRWVSLALTFKDRALALYVDGQLAASAKDVAPPRLWSFSARGDGLCLCGAAGRGAAEMAISDLRISQLARTPGKPVDFSSLGNRLVIDPAKPTGQTIRQTLLGGLHTLRGPETEKMARQAPVGLNVLRTDKLITVTPIKRGEPDAEHPSRGVTSQFSYDWQVVDRTFDYYKRLGILPYISIDSTPKILGGKVPPFSGQALQEKRSFSSGFGPQIPSDFEAFGQIVQDLVHHVIVERKDRVPYWGVWNEPDGPSFWNQNVEDYLRLYDVCAAAVKKVDPALKVGGPEVAHFDVKWVEPLIRHCAEKKVPLDFVAWHFYNGTIGQTAFVRDRIAKFAKQYALPAMPELIIGEWCWQPHNFPKTGYGPWRNYNYYLNDFHAAFTAATLIEMQRAGIVMSIYTNPVAEDQQGGFQASGLMSATHPWANLNAFRLWARLGPDEVESKYTGRPGVYSVGSQDGKGRVTILLSRVQYRKDRPTDVAIQCAGLNNKSNITHYVIDAAHSNAFDAGVAHAELEMVSPPAVKGDTMTIEVGPRSVHLLVIE